MTICPICGNGVLTIERRRYHLFGCGVSKLSFWIKRQFKDLGMGIGFNKFYKCDYCNKTKWGILMKHTLTGGGGIHGGGESYNVVALCRQCCRIKVRKQKNNINRGIQKKVDIGVTSIYNL